MQFDINASMMFADYGHLEQEVQKLEKSGVDSFHIDIIDGRFVPDFAMSLNDMRFIASAAKKPLDVHLMIEHPNEQIDLFLKSLRPGDTVYIHSEAEYHPSTTLQKIIDAKMVPGIAINPGTSVETVYEMLRIVKKVLVMTVNPGENAQMYETCVARKLTKLISLKEDMDFSIYLDGMCTREKILEMAPKGVDGFVLGNEILFEQGKSYETVMKELRDISLNDSVINVGLISHENKVTKVG